jgi:hypothetical protein
MFNNYESIAEANKTLNMIMIGSTTCLIYQCTCKSTVRNTRILGFRLIIGCLENALKSSIYSLSWAWVSVAWFPSNRGIYVF